MTSDGSLLQRIRMLWRTTDPMPDGLAERVLFALELEDLDVELLRMQESPALAARAEETLRSVTFTTDQLTMLLTLPADAGGPRRIDGWLAPGAGLRVELRLTSGSQFTVADDTGRFSFGAVPPGPAQIVLHPTDGAAVQLVRAVATPAMSV